MKHTGVTILAMAAILAVPLAADAQDAQIVPDSLDFGQVCVGDSVVLPFQVRSIDPEFSLTVDEIYITEDPSGSFEITLTEPAVLPADLDLGESMLVEVTYVPMTAGTHSGTVTVRSNDHDDPVIDVPLTGEGASAVSLEGKELNVSFRFPDTDTVFLGADADIIVGPGVELPVFFTQETDIDVSESRRPHLTGTCFRI